MKKRPIRHVLVSAAAALSLSLFLFYHSSVSTFLQDSCVCHCGLDPQAPQDPEAHLWLSHRHNLSARVLLSRSNAALDPQTFRWWRLLQNESTVANYSEVVQQLFSLFSEPHLQSGSSCRTCAVVGNSGNLVRSHYGPLIDSNDFIIRMNQGPTAGFERDVGSKTTHRLIYPESAVDLDDNTHLVFLPFKILDLQWLISVFTTKHIDWTYTYVRPSIEADKKKVMIIHPAFMKYVHDSWLQSNGDYPSTGFMSIIFALHICDEVNVFGFGPTHGEVWHHYFDDFVVDSNGGPHAGDFERSVMAELHQKQIIVMYKGW